jgi:transposase
MLTLTDKSIPGRRRRLDPRPRFKVSRNQQLDAVNGTPELQLAASHLARKVWRQMEKLDVSAIEAKYSSLGRRGFAPRRVLAVLVYASLIGLHHSTKIAAAMKTDAALRWLCGGWAISSATLRRFRQHNGDLFIDAIEQTVGLAVASGMLKPDELSTDSVRLRAHASTNASRTVERSTRRLKELAAIDVTKLDEAERREHDAKVAKHRAALKLCQEQGRTNVVVTSPSAGLLKFPNGASGPGHRVTVVAGGKKSRVAVAVLIDADGVDYGKLGPAVLEARRVLLDAGLREDTHIRVRADAGYWSKDDLQFAAANASWLDALIAEGSGTSKPKAKEHFTREQFVILDNRSARCPADRPMRGPFPQKDGTTHWRGEGCAACSLRAKCTPGKQRTLIIDFEADAWRAKMRERMKCADAKELYGERIATIEPVFSSIEDRMGFRRVSSRLPQTVRAEILLKVLAHNVARLIARLHVWFVVVMLPDGVSSSWSPAHLHHGAGRDADAVTQFLATL